MIITLHVPFMVILLLFSTSLVLSFIINHNVHPRDHLLTKHRPIISSKIKGLQHVSSHLYLLASQKENDIDNSSSSHLTIEYCTGCRWMLRSAWLMQELLTTFSDEMSSVALIPSKPPSPAGTFVSLK